jgi:hypothetical protein
MSFKPSLWDVDEWFDHPRLRFATREEAEQYGVDFVLNGSVTHCRVVESSEPVNCRYAARRVHADPRHLRPEFDKGFSWNVLDPKRAQ